MKDNHKELHEIIKDRIITKLSDVSFGGLNYEQWQLEPTIFSDQVESLLENGFSLWIDSNHTVLVNKLKEASPMQIQQNKHFLRTLQQAIEDENDY